MSDELDGQLLQRFAESHRPLADAQFVAQIGQRREPADALGTLCSAWDTARAGIAIGVGTVWRRPYTRLMALLGAALSLWAVFA